jgi:hypothetical protein
VFEPTFDPIPEPFIEPVMEALDAPSAGPMDSPLDLMGQDALPFEFPSFDVEEPSFDGVKSHFEDEF